MGDVATAVAGETATYEPALEAATSGVGLTEPRSLPLSPAGRVLLHTPERFAPRRDTVGRRALAAADVIALVLAQAIVQLVVPPDATLLERWYLVLALPLWVVLNKLLGLYDRDASRIHKSTLDEVPAIALSITLGTALLFLFGPAVPGIELGRTQSMVFLVTGLLLTPGMRCAARAAVRRRIEPERCLILGSGQVADIVARKLAAHPEYGTDLVGYVDVASDRAVADTATVLPRLGDDASFEAVCQQHRVERVVVAFSSVSDERLLDVIRVSKRLHVKITVVPRLFEVIGGGVEFDEIEGMTLLGLRGVTRTKSTLRLKRCIDLAGAAAGLLVVAPVLGLCAVAVKLTSPGPVLFRQPRIGRANRPFTMLKFRTMVDGADHLKSSLSHLNEMSDGPMFKIADDPRVTPVGRFLRRTSLDELPQLWNVLRGEMSLVGPRPLVPSESDKVLGWHRARLDLTPGLTGPWQVMGRNTIPFEEMIKLDYLYVAEWSLWSDIKLLLRTVPALLWRTGY